MPALGDETLLVSKAKQGDQEAFSLLMTQYEKSIYKLAFRMVHSIEDAEELTQTTFLKAWENLPKFDGDSSFFTWLYRLAKNTSIDFLRRQQRRTAVLNTLSIDDDEQNTMQIPSFTKSPEETILQKDKQSELYQALNKLSDEHRDILLQREMDGLSYTEIAEHLGLSLGTVKSRIARARLSLRTILQKEGNYFSSSASKQIESKKHGGDAP